MVRFRIYCTEEQTQKAIKLGAPINTMEDLLDSQDKREQVIDTFYVNGVIYEKPTAEEMVHWLSDVKNIHIGIIELNSGVCQGYINRSIFSMV